MNSVLDGHPDAAAGTWILCKELGVLPYPGGLYNQPARVVESYILYVNSVEAKRKLDEGSKR